MAEINIQPKKTAPSPWLLVLLAVALLAAAAYFFLRPDPVDTTTPDSQVTAAPVSAVPNGDSVTDSATSAFPNPVSADTADAQRILPLTSSELAAYAATDAAAPGYARRGLLQLVATLIDLADRADLQDPAIQEQRNNLTSATARLNDEPAASIRPGYVAAASLLRAIQQKAYPEQEAATLQLQQLAGQLSGQTATTDDQQQIRQVLTMAAGLLDPLSQPPASR